MQELVVANVGALCVEDAPEAIESRGGCRAADQIPVVGTHATSNTEDAAEPVSHMASQRTIGQLFANARVQSRKESNAGGKASTSKTCWAPKASSDSKAYRVRQRSDADVGLDACRKALKEIHRRIMPSSCPPVIETEIKSFEKRAKKLHDAVRCLPSCTRDMTGVVVQLMCKVTNSEMTPLLLQAVESMRKGYSDSGQVDKFIAARLGQDPTASVVTQFYCRIVDRMDATFLDIAGMFPLCMEVDSSVIVEVMALSTWCKTVTIERACMSAGEFSDARGGVYFSFVNCFVPFLEGGDNFALARAFMEDYALCIQAYLQLSACAYCMLEETAFLKSQLRLSKGTSPKLAPEHEDVLKKIASGDIVMFWVRPACVDSSNGILSG